MDYNGNGGSHEVEAPNGRPPLGAMLIEGDFLTEAQLVEALEEGAEKGERLGEVVVRRGWATEDEVAKLLAEQWQLGYVDRASIWFDGQALGRMTREDAQRLEALPTSVQDGRVVVAVAEPTEQRLTALKAIMGDDAVVVVVPRSALDAGLRSDLLTGSRDTEDAHTKEDDVSAKSTDSIAEDDAGQAFAAAETDLAPTLVALEAAVGDASVLQASLGELGERLVEIMDDLTDAAAQLMANASARAEDEARINRLEEQLTQRTELGESLKSQLASLSETLESFS